jgi:hypothetical protein
MDIEGPKVPAQLTVNISASGIDAGGKRFRVGVVFETLGFIGYESIEFRFECLQTPLVFSGCLELTLRRNRSVLQHPLDRVAGERLR